MDVRSPSCEAGKIPANQSSLSPTTPIHHRWCTHRPSVVPALLGDWRRIARVGGGLGRMDRLSRGEWCRNRPRPGSNAIRRLKLRRSCEQRKRSWRRGRSAWASIRPPQDCHALDRGQCYTRPALVRHRCQASSCKASEPVGHPRATRGSHGHCHNPSRGIPSILAAPFCVLRRSGESDPMHCDVTPRLVRIYRAEPAVLHAILPQVSPTNRLGSRRRMELVLLIANLP